VFSLRTKKLSKASRVYISTKHLKEVIFKKQCVPFSVTMVVLVGLLQPNNGA
jgi:hypothetical protein